MSDSYLNKLCGMMFVGLSGSENTSVALSETNAFDGSMTITPKHDKIKRDPVSPGRFTRSIVRGGNGPHDVKVEFDWIPDGNGGQFLATFFGQGTQRDGFNIDHASTTTSIVTSDQGVIEIGYVIPVLINDVVHYRWVTDVTAGQDTDAITITPALPHAPPHNPPTVVNTYNNSQLMKNAIYFATVGIANNMGYYEASGICFDGLEIKADRNKCTAFTVDGKAKHYLEAGNTTLHAAIANGQAASMIVEKSWLFKGIDSNHPVKLTILGDVEITIVSGVEVPIVHDAETVIATAMTDNEDGTMTLTITRGQNAGAHAVSAEVVPYLCTVNPTLDTQAIPGVEGEVAIDGLFLEMESWTLKITMGVKQTLPYGSLEMGHHYINSKGSISFEGSFYPHKDVYQLISKAHEGTPVNGLFTVGAGIGEAFGAFLPNIVFEEVAMDGKPEDDPKFSLKSFEVCNTENATTDDAVTIAFVGGNES